ncbi:MAG: FtsX-like permease family protein [Bacteroidota bacterium]
MTNCKYSLALSFSLETFWALEIDRKDNWNDNNTFTYLLLDDPSNYGRFLTNLEDLNERLKVEEKLSAERVAAQLMKDIHLHSDKSFEAEVNGDYYSVIFLFGIAILVIVIAVVNYINLSTAKSLDRAKEVGIRKVLGSSTSMLRSQFFTESVILNFLAGLIALIFISIALGPFKVLASLPDDFELFTSAFFWVSFGAILVLNSLVSGIFPALILSSFKPLGALRGKYGASPRGAGLRRVLVVLQFAITSFLLVLTLVITQQLQHMREKDLGADIERVIAVNVPGDVITEQGAMAFASAVRNHQDFNEVSATDCLPGMPAHQMGTTTGVNPVDALEKPNNNMYIMFADAHFVPTLNINLLAGENFREKEVEDVMIVNDEAMRVWGYATPEEVLDHRIGMWGKEWQVRGVFESFHQFSPKEPHIPMILLYGDHADSDLSFFGVRATAGDPKEKVAALQTIFELTFPSSSFEYFFLDEFFNRQYNEDRRFQQVFGVLTVFAMVIAALGLFGLASFSIAKRAKEIGIRKVLGATVTQLVALISSSFLKLVGISFLITIPIAIYFINDWLSGFSYRIALSAWMFAVPAVGVVLVAFLSVLAKTYGVSVQNPVKSLRDE